MARTINPEKLASKRNEILDAAMRLVFTKGYEQMSVQDILNEIQISNGAFHHYFKTRGELLEAVTERMEKEAEKPFLTIIHDPELTAIEKLQGLLDTLDRMRLDRQAGVVKLLHTWFTDDNALLRVKFDQAIFKQRALLISEIVQQGLREGVFHTSYPDQAGQVVMALLQAMGNTHARLMLSLAKEIHNPAGSQAGLSRLIDDIVKIHAAYMDAIERVLGAPSHSLHRTDAEAVNVWVTALRENDPTEPAGQSAWLERRDQE